MSFVAGPGLCIAKAQLKSYEARLQYRLAELRGALITAARQGYAGSLRNSNMKCAQENLRQLAEIYRAGIHARRDLRLHIRYSSGAPSRSVIGGMVFKLTETDTCCAL
jgi:hypothetical protein